MTKQFPKWASRQDIPENELYRALEEVQAGRFEANLGGPFTKKEFDLWAKVKVAVGGQLSAIKKTIRRFLFTNFQKMKNQIYRGRSFLPSKNYRKF